MAVLIDGIVGTRPNMMKMAAIARAFGQRAGLSLRLIHTGQHYDALMSEVFLRQLGLPTPDVNLGVGPGTQCHQFAEIMRLYGAWLETQGRPQATLVVGDVTSTAACAIAATKSDVPVVHVEAGLRSGDLTMPEEINRILTDSISDLLLVSDPDGLINLAREGHASHKIRFVGNVMIDTMLHELDQVSVDDLTARYGVQAGGYAYMTLHRPSNVDNRESLAGLIGAAEAISREVPVVFAVHPRTQGRLDEFGIALPAHAGFIATPPLAYHENIALIKHARVILSDSGGIQEESSALNVPCLTLRFNTERPCTVQYGCSQLVGNDPARILAAWGDIRDGKRKVSSPIPFWDGRAAERIADLVQERYG